MPPCCRGRSSPPAGTSIPPSLPIQQHYAEAGGVPSALVDILVLSETLERRVRASYQRHLAEEATDPGVGEVLGAILAEMEAKHGAEHAGWIEEALNRANDAEVSAARQKWQVVDSDVALALRRSLDERFGMPHHAHDVPLNHPPRHPHRRPRGDGAGEQL